MAVQLPAIEVFFPFFQIIINIVAMQHYTILHRAILQHIRKSSRIVLATVHESVYPGYVLFFSGLEC